MIKRVLLLGVSLVFIFCFGAFGAEDIKIGVISDISGPTSDVGKDAAMGIKEAIRYFNDTGGINGKKIKAFQEDYGYQVPRADMLYKKFKGYCMALFLQWGTGDTEALSKTVNADKIPTISDSFSGHLCNPVEVTHGDKKIPGKPYNFIYSTDYSTNARACLTVWFNKVWKQSDKWKAARDAGKKPKLVCFYSVGHPYASAPIEAIKDQAKLLGIEVSGDQNVPLVATDADSQVLAAKKEEPTVVWHGNTTQSVKAAITSARRLQLDADHIVNNWGFDENLLKLVADKKELEGVIGAAACAFYGDDVPMMKEVLDYGKKVNPGVPVSDRTIRAVKGWLKVAMAAGGLQIADKKGKLDGPSIKAAFETFKDWSAFGKPNALGRSPLTITDKDHRPSSIASIYWIKDGKITLLEQVDMQKAFPKEWPTWLGW